MKPAQFTYHRPQSLDEALRLLAECGEDARPLAGGQSLVPMMNMRVARPEHLIDLNDLGDLDFIRERAGRIEIGAMTRHRAVERSELLKRACPVLPAVAATIGHHAIRERGTVGGSLALADPSAQWPLLAVLLEAQIELAGPAGRRSVAAADFFAGVFSTAILSGELLTFVSFPLLAPNESWGYRGFTRRHGDFAIVAAAALIALDRAGHAERLRLALSGVGDRPVRLDAVTHRFLGRDANAIAYAELGCAAAAAVTPLEDAIGSAAFRRDLVAVLSAEAVADAAERARAKP